MKYRITNGAVVIGGESILNEINFEITDKDHIGIVGRNGSGKTTLLKAIIDNDMLEEGLGEESFEIQKIGNFKIGYQSQITFDDEDITLLDEIKKSYSEITRLENKIQDLVSVMERDTSDQVIKEYSELMDRFQSLGGYSYKKEYEVMLHKFGFGEEDKNRPIKSFSGGERTKIAFIKLLLSKPDLLLLDEPTNHLDIEAVEWLEGYLKNYKGAFIVVSHDRMFLNNVVNKIYDITNGKLTKYIGDYEKYEKERYENYEKTLMNYEKQQSEIARLRALYERFRSKPSKASMALAKLHILEKMDVLEKPEKLESATFNMNLSKIVPSSKNVITCKNISFGYDDVVLGNINFDVQLGERVGIIGANGAGKSTLIKTVAGKLNPIKGHIQYGFNVNMGYFDQALEFNDLNNTVLDEFLIGRENLSKTDARKILGAFLFRGDDVFKKISVLSGGEKVALSLCKVLYDKPNFLLLDEPTNHMDIRSKENFEKVLSTYKGTIMFVSHDRYFIRKIATNLIIFDENGCRYFRGNYDDYIYERNKNKDKVEEVKEEKEKKTTIKVERSNDNLKSEKKELRDIEKKIVKLEGDKKKIEKELFDNATDYIKTSKLNGELNEIEKNLESLNSRWSELVDIVS